jgi:O-6-methylguanine DNA methyltransferase
MSRTMPQPPKIVPEAVIERKLKALKEVNPPHDLRGRILEQLDLADRYFRFQTVAGEVYIAYNRRGISFIERVDQVSDFEREFRKRFDRPVFYADTPPTQLRSQIEAALCGASRRRPRFDLSRSTEFERSVLLKALEIPFGQVRPYTWIAREIGRPKAQRAVGSALAGNPIPLLIPCHRVVRSDGIIGNYGMGGPTVKRRLLEFEGADPGLLEQLGRSGFRFVGSDTTHIFCFPTCSHARRVTPRHTMRFSSTNQAHDAGYRACKVCRPDI